MIQGASPADESEYVERVRCAGAQGSGRPFARHAHARSGVFHGGSHAIGTESVSWVMTRSDGGTAMGSTGAGRKGRLLGVLLMGPFMAQADATIANVATPSIHAELGATGAVLELVIGGYLIAFAVLLITGARLGQTHGYKRVFLIGIGIFSLASLLCGLAPDPTVLVGARVLQGAGAALMFPQTLTGIQLNFSGEARKRAIGLYAIALSAGGVIGQIFGGALISANLADTQWRAIFLINVPIGIAGIAAAERYLPADAHRVSRRVDLPGVAMMSVSVLLVVLPLSLVRREGWPAWTWVCLAAILPAIVPFIPAQRHLADRDGAPLVNIHMLANRPILCGLATLLAATGTYYALLFTLAQYLQQGLGHSALVSGLTLVPWVAAFGVAGQIVRRLPAARGVVGAPPARPPPNRPPPPPPPRARRPPAGGAFPPAGGPPPTRWL